MTLYREPDWMYVSQTLNDLRWECLGMHNKVAEIEALKYYEDRIALSPEERRTNKTIRIGLTAELIENVKAAILANIPRVHVEAFRKHSDATKNSSNREKFWQNHIENLAYPVNILAELVDEQLLGCGILKSAKNMTKWSSAARRKRANESVEDHVDRVTALKQMWGLPSTSLVTPILSSYFRPGIGAQVEELIEHAYKPWRTVYSDYNLNGSDLRHGEDVANLPGQPDSIARALPSGVDTSQYRLVTEYWNPGIYQVYVNASLVYSERNPGVAYFIAPGRSSSSTDPDKFAISIAESMRHNEPQLNALLTRMIEAADVIVNKRLGMKVPESYTPETVENEAHEMVPRTWTFRDDVTEPLPPGADVFDPYAGAEAIYEALPLVNLLMQIMAQHGVSSLFKGISPGAAGSGYRDNSLYLMAKSMFQYIISSLQACLSAYITWQEWLLVHHIKQPIYSGPYCLKPSDITDWPAKVSVELKPMLPQNLIAEGEFWSRMNAEGYVSKRRVREHALGIEAPDEEEEAVDDEQLWDQMKPYLFMDAIGSVLGKGPMAADQGQSGLVGPDGQTPLTSNRLGGGTSTNGRTTGEPGVGRDIGRALGGRATAGQPRNPPAEPASFPPGNEEPR